MSLRLAALPHGSRRRVDRVLNTETLEALFAFAGLHLPPPLTPQFPALFVSHTLPNTHGGILNAQHIKHPASGETNSEIDRPVIHSVFPQTRNIAILGIPAGSPAKFVFGKATKHFHRLLTRQVPEDMKIGPLLVRPCIQIDLPRLKLFPQRVDVVTVKRRVPRDGEEPLLSSLINGDCVWPFPERGITPQTRHRRPH